MGIRVFLLAPKLNIIKTTINKLKNEQYTTKDISLLFGAMDDKGKIAFKQGFVNQLIGDANKIKNLPKVLEQLNIYMKLVNLKKVLGV